MAGISDEKLQELRDRVDVVAVVQRRVSLKKSGRDWKGLCPFHGEKTPSFYVVPDKHIFHCFGCGATGDAIKFVMQLDGKSFREAAEELAAEAGIDLKPADPEEARRSARRAALAEVNEKACVFYERVLWEHPRGQVAREHLTRRGIAVETAKAWRLGYAPDQWDQLCKSLARGKVDQKLVEEAGLGVPRKKQEGLYDRFRGRLMIPIREAGRAVGFGGRLLEGQSEAKYLNSPDTPLYTKGGVLFALDKARDAIRREGVALFVEGYFDAIGLHQAGVQTAVATCGTALTERHLELVQRAGARELVFVFDGDAAGLRAAQRASEIAAAAAVPARVLVPPRGEDPDETVLRIGVKAFRELLSSAQPALEFLLDRALEKAGTSIEERVKTVEAVAGIVRAAPTPLARDLYLEKVAQRIDAPLDAVRAAVDGRRAPAKKPAQQPVRGQPSGRPQTPQNLALVREELAILAYALHSADFAKVVDDSGALARFTVAAVREVAERALAGAREGNLAADALVSSIDSDRLREALLRESAEQDRAGRSRRDLELKLSHHRRIAEQEAALRKVLKNPSVERIRPR
ncbi:MAG TPA: DNA primase [Myxococcales bacterium]|nr:DNA primase [Myxococcales bacterium]